MHLNVERQEFNLPTSETTDSSKIPYLPPDIPVHLNSKDENSVFSIFIHSVTSLFIIFDNTTTYHPFWFRKSRYTVSPVLKANPPTVSELV